MFWPLRGNVNGTRERTERGCIYHRQIISKESSSNDKQLTKQARCRWHEPYGNFIENRYRRRGISNVRIKYSKTLAVVLAGSIVAGVPKNILPLLFLSPGQNPRGGYTWPKKNLFSKPIVAGPRRPIDFESTIEFQFQPYLFFFFLLPFFFALHPRKSERSREEIIFPKKKKKKISLDYMQSPRYYWIERILESKLKIVTSVGLKRNSRRLY